MVTASDEQLDSASLHMCVLAMKFNDVFFLFYIGQNAGSLYSNIRKCVGLNIKNHFLPLFFHEYVHNKRCLEPLPSLVDSPLSPVLTAK